MRKYFCLLILTAGCVNDLDKKQSLVRQQFGQTCVTMGAIMKKNCEVTDQFAAESFKASAAHIDRNWKAFLESHTAPDGRLVSKAADGSLKPMLVADLVQAMIDRQDALVKLAMAQANWKQQQDKYMDAINQFMITTNMLNQQEVDVQLAKESAQATLDKALTAIGTVAGAVGIMAPLAF